MNIFSLYRDFFKFLEKITPHSEISSLFSNKESILSLEL